MTLSAYELERQARLEENAKLLASLGLSVQPSPKKTDRRPAKSFKSPTTPRSDRPRRQTFRSTPDPTYQPSPSPKKQGQKRRQTQGQNHVVFERGGRIYDSINGTSCHQCRQKTLDRKETCSVEGCTLMMCFRCLPNRYGQTIHVSPSITTTTTSSDGTITTTTTTTTSSSSDGNKWVCPRCLGVCNCSFCMKKSGRAPTGILAPEAFKLGFESVAAMLAVKGGSAGNTARSKISSRKRKRRASSSSEEESASNESESEVEELEEEEESAPIGTETAEEYTVAAIVAAHLINRELFFQTRWEGYTEQDDTMEPYATVVNLLAMDVFEATDGVVEYRGLLVPVAQALAWRAESKHILVDAFEGRLRDVKGGPSRRQSRRLTR